MPLHRAQNKQNLANTALGGSLIPKPRKLPVFAARSGRYARRLPVAESAQYGLLAVPLEGEAGQGWERLEICFSSPAAKRASASAFTHGGAARLSLIGWGGWCGAFLEEACAGLLSRSAEDDWQLHEGRDF
ncbi:hypothetical protein RZS08_61120, partial [Arthrospira platensis SPKY1]|nr:hypothetical protein [Arthrospira platensis SPKY1]